MAPTYPPRRGAPRIIFENQYQRTYALSADFGDAEKEYCVTDYGRRVGIVAVQADDVLLVRQYRLLIDCCSWEIPGGGVDADETPEAAARRECKEETGLTCRHLQPLVYFQPGLDTVNNPTTVFLATELEGTLTAARDHFEVIERLWVPFPRTLEMVFAGEISDAMSVVGLLAYQVAKGRPGA